MTKKNDFKMIQNHLKETGFIFPNSEIYGGLSNTYDYGPLGTLLINNIKSLWFREFITQEPNNYPLEARTLLNPEVWKASGHLDNFQDPLIENKINKKRYRADHVIKQFDKNVKVEKMSFEEMEKFLLKKVHNYDNSKTDWGPVRNFNLMFETYQGVIEENKHKIFLRPELAQGIFINFKNVQKSMRAKIPFGIGQIGHSFRNEVTPRNFTFRTREFEQMELEYFVKPGEDEKAFEYYRKKIETFLKLLGLNKKNFKFREHLENELAHYAKRTLDIEYNFPFGWGEIIGLANRGQFDLKSHMMHSKVNLTYVDGVNFEVFIPAVIEPSMGVDRIALAVLVDAFETEIINKKERITLKINKNIAPYQLAVLPLLKKLHSKKANEIFQTLNQQGLRVVFDETGSLGKRYVRQDMIGTPFCITIDDQSLTKKTVTLRYRDNMNQIRINIDEINKHL